MIDNTTGLFLEVKDELERTTDKNTDNLILRASNQQELHDFSRYGNTIDKNGDPIIRLYVKLGFYFSKACSQALPLIALQYHDVQLKISTREFKDLVVYTSNTNQALNPAKSGAVRKATIMANYVYLDSMERRLFAGQQTALVV
jgi:hypothetical protein